MGNFKILRASAEHIPYMVPLFDDYRRFYGRPSNREEGRLFLTERLNRNESVILLAFEGEQAVGFIQLYPTFSSEWVKGLWILNDLFVIPQARRQGVGEALLQEAKLLAKQTGAKGLVLETGIENVTAQRLYERLGWKRDELFYRYYLDV